ncbi:MAG: hypothetical protein JW846_10215 [Dehalococcoidia bacterium]|nr:hypothetical protein [Dehalococcoidia bacterium]
MSLRKIRWKGSALGVTCVLLLGMLGGLSCAGAPADEAASDGEQQADVPAESGEGEKSNGGDAPVADWIADGEVTPGEYAGTLDKGTYRLHWVSTTDTIRMAIEAGTSGWVAVGFQPGNRMKDADIVMGMVSDGQAIVIDSFSTGDFGPHRADSEFGGTDDLLEYDALESDGMTVVEFERALDTGDEYDVALQRGLEVGLIWAYGSTDSEGEKHSTRGYAEIVP